MKIKFKPCQRKRIRKFLSGFHGKERTDLYKIFTAIAYLVYTGCQWKMLPQYYPPPRTVYYNFRKWSESTKLVFFLRSLVAEGRRKMSRKSCACTIHPYLWSGLIKDTVALIPALTAVSWNV